MKKNNVRALTEGAIMAALAQVLGYLKFFSMPNGGSITLAMIPIIFYAVRWGLGKGLLVAFVFGLLQFVLDGAYAYTWQSIILDYLLAYTLMGVAGAFKKVRFGIFYGTIAASVLRFAALTLSGVYVWSEYMPEEFLGMPMASPWIYSPIYNSIYVGANMVIALVVFAALYKPMNKYIAAGN